jgi:CheY-like chemotaxis protein
LKGQNKRVLVVDDDAPIRQLVGTVLRREGYAVDQAHDGQEAIDAIRVTQYDAIVLDLMMPRVSGYEVLDFIQRERGAVRCVVVVSAAASQDIEKANRSVVRALIRKPFELQELTRAVRQCVSGSDDGEP